MFQNNLLNPLTYDVEIKNLSFLNEDSNFLIIGNSEKESFSAPFSEDEKKDRTQELKDDLNCDVNDNEEVKDKFMDDCSERSSCEEKEEEFKSKMYILFIDDIPYFYEDDINVARANLFRLAHRLKNHLNCDQRNILLKSPEEIEVVNIFDFSFFKYHHVLHTLRIDYVCKIDDDSLNFA